MTEYYQYLYAYIAHRVGNFNDVEDILQDTYLAALTARNPLRDPAACKSWLRSIAEHKIKQHYRRKAIYNTRHTGEEPDVELSVPDTAADGMTAEAALSQLQQAVLKLPADLRGCTVVSLMCGLSGQDAGEILEIPVTTVYNRVHKVKKLLRAELEDLMEISLETFSAVMEAGKPKAERLAEYMQTFYALNDQGKFDDMASLILTSPVFAGDCPMAHYMIMQYCTMALRIIREPDRSRIAPVLIHLGESEFRLAEKLGFAGIVDDETGEDVPEYTFYEGAADFYSCAGKYEQALDMCKMAKTHGAVSEMAYAMILQDMGRYHEAVTVFMREAEHAGERDTKRYMAYNRIANCLKALGDIRGQLAYQLKNYEAVAGGLIYSEPDAHAHFLGGEAYYLAMTYANLDEYENMLHYLTEAVRLDSHYREWAKAQGAFAKYKTQPEFIQLCGEGEGRFYTIKG